MTKKLETKLEIKSWDEQPYREFPDGSKFTRAEVVLAGDETGLESAHFDALMYYRPDGTSAYVSLLELTGAIDGREGTVVLRGEGSYDGTTAKSKSTVVHGTGDLADLKMTVDSASTHDDYPFMPLTLKYE
jgi:hypothetical protein